MTATLYLGTHRPHWLAAGLGVPLFVSRRTLAARGGSIMDRRSLPVADTPWVLDSGGFTELNLHGSWSLTVDQYADEILRCEREIGHLAWAAPMDYMCEPSVRAKTGLSVVEHQQRTITNFLALREIVGETVAPVLQGWEWHEYLEHVGMYAYSGVDLTEERIVGVGSICRRGQDAQIVRVVHELYSSHGLRMHGFGIRGTAYQELRGVLESADSMAWSMDGRYHTLPSCAHRSCQNCSRYAVRWHQQLTDPRQVEREAAHRVFAQTVHPDQERLDL